MCGIFLLYYDKNDKNETWNTVNENFNLGKFRGPDNSYIQIIKDYYLGFHRLSINGLNQISNQPFIKSNIYLICNGEIYNYKYLYTLLNIEQSSNSDCEIIIDLYLQGWNIFDIVSILDGVFSFIIYDTNINKIIVARDPLGVRPLYYIYNEKLDKYSFASELKQLNTFGKVNVFKPGQYFIDNKFYTYYTLCNNLLFFLPRYNLFENEMDNYINLIQNSLINSVKKRLLSDRPIACLLSGGLDSSLICSIVAKLLPQQIINTFSIGLKGSTDLKYAKIVSKYLNTIHTEIVLSEDEFFEAIPHVIKTIESYDVTTVRASVGNYLISKYISNKTNFKVIFNGDGSDELTGGYLYFNKSPNKLVSHNECIKLLQNIHYFDVLRSDKCISSCGLEPRTPFLDKSFVNLYLSIPLEYRFPTNKIEKYLLRKSFKTFLPENILYRKKEAFSDGVSSENNSWYKIIHEKLQNLYPDMAPGVEIEKKFYINKFNSYYPNQEHIIPYYWMPKWSKTLDPSARTL